MNVIQSGEEGFLCHQWKVVGAEKASEFASFANNWFAQTERLLSNTAVSYFMATQLVILYSNYLTAN